MFNRTVLRKGNLWRHGPFFKDRFLDAYCCDLGFLGVTVKPFTKQTGSPASGRPRHTWGFLRKYHKRWHGPPPQRQKRKDMLEYRDRIGRIFLSESLLPLFFHPIEMLHLGRPLRGGIDDTEDRPLVQNGFQSKDRSEFLKGLNPFSLHERGSRPIHKAGIRCIFQLRSEFVSLASTASSP